MATNPLAEDLDHILGCTEGLWDELRGERVFITGGTGFFGCWLLESFVWANDRLVLGASALVLTRNPDALKHKAPHLAAHPAIQFHVGDVRSFEFPTRPFAHVIHAATESSAKLSAEEPVRMFQTIVLGTERVLEFARHCGARRFLLTSSGAVYGRQPSGMTHIAEDYQGAPDPTDPRWVYGSGKRAAETLCALYAGRGLEPTIARGFAFVGPHLPLDTHFAVGNFIRDALAGGPIRVNGDGTPYRSYLYAADLAVWLWTILLRGQPLRPYNVGSAVDLTIEELAQLVAHQCSPPVPVTVAQVPRAGISAERYVPSVARAETDLALRPTIPLAEAIRRTIAWHTGG
ncbi:MAG: epimerase [Acidobacteria bacterium RIFCSPLOWO2_12_FULL_65_11]|nr:MAG: epimerase [Acidobacteria bacterium RIFCSPLOWO2_12_FULL_65_11]